MKRIHGTCIILFVTISLIISGCSSPAGIPPISAQNNSAIPTDPSAAIASATPIPTIPPTATSIPPTPTFTPVPPTPTATAPAKVAEYLNGVTVTLNEPLGKDFKDGWWFDTAQRNQENISLPGTDSWSGFGRDESRQFGPGEGYLINFSFRKDSVFEMLLQHEKFFSDQYRRFGIYVENGSGKSNLWQGKTLFSNYLHGNLTMHPDTKYTLLMAIIGDREFLGVVWDNSAPTKALTYREKLGPTWSGLTYTLSIGANKGVILFDSYQEIKFDGPK